jgi:parvulin-like peptidyl-prolyl isomerase
MPEGQQISAGPEGSSCCGGEHGGTHSGCCGGSETALADQACEEHENCCMQHYDLKTADYRELVRAMVLEQMIQQYVRENNIGQKQDTQALIKYVTENVYVTDAHLEMEESMRPSEAEIRTYYEENKETFALKTLNEVRGQIEAILKKRMHRDYMPRYIVQLKRDAFIRKNQDLLAVQEPSESELRSYYRAHRSEYEEPARIKVRQIIINSRRKAEEAQSRLWTGTSFAAVEEEYSEGSYADSGGENPSYKVRDYPGGGGAEERCAACGYVTRGKRSEIFDENVFHLREGDTSMIFEDNGLFYIVQVLEKHEERIKSFEEVYDSIRGAVMKEAEARLYEENAHRTLFTVNDRSYTVEEFKKHYDGLAPAAHERYSDISGREELVDSMIEFELLVGDARRKMFDLKNKEVVQDLTNAVLEGTLYKNEIIGKVSIEDISDEDAGRYYEENKEKFIEPPKAKVSYIRVAASDVWGKAPTSEELKAAQKKAEEAYGLIEAGTEFDKVARKYSADDWSYQKLTIHEEQDMPMTTLNELVMHPLHEEVFALNEGEVSEPFEFRSSYYIFKLWEKSGKGYVPFEGVKGVIKEVLLLEKRRERAESLKEDLMGRAQLVLNERALDAMARRQTERKEEQDPHAEHGG